MNGRQERERQKTQLLRQIQQQRLELSASVRSNMRLFRSAPFSTTPFTSRHTRTGGGPSRSVHFRLRVLIAQKL